jgi:hypothetical protein
MSTELAPNVMDAVLLASAASEILETMFFVAAEPMAPVAEPPCVAARVDFAGARTGRFEIRLDQPLAEEMACGFLGVEDPSALAPADLAQMTKELANIICGASLSRFASGAIFNLDPPRLPSPAEAVWQPDTTQWLDCGTGRIRLAFAWTTPEPVS